MGILINILKLGRFHFLIGGFFLFSLGALWSLLNGADFIVEKFVWGYAILFTGHLSVSYSNDYFDTESDRFSTPTLFAGGSGILVKHPELRIFAKWIALSLIGISLLLTVGFTIMYSFPFYFIIFVLVGNLVGWFYTAPPLRLSYRGMGEITVMITMGFLMPIMGYLVLAKEIGTHFFIIGVPLLIYGLDFILNVEIPDMEADRISKKKTLIARKGRPFGFATITICLLLVTLYFFGLSLISLELTNIDYRVLTLFSLLPLGVGIMPLTRKNTDKNNSTMYANNNMAALVIFIVIINIYFTYHML